MARSKKARTVALAGFGGRVLAADRDLYIHTTLDRTLGSEVHLHECVLPSPAPQESHAPSVLFLLTDTSANDVHICIHGTETQLANLLWDAASIAKLYSAPHGSESVSVVNLTGASLNLYREGAGSVVLPSAGTATATPRDVGGGMPVGVDDYMQIHTAPGEPDVNVWAEQWDIVGLPPAERGTVYVATPEVARIAARVGRHDVYYPGPAIGAGEDEGESWPEGCDGLVLP